MQSARERLMPLEQFLAWEREQERSYEFAGGVATMRTGQTLGHGTIMMNLFAGLREKLRGSGCRVFVSSVKVIANGTVRYPDLSVTCEAVNGKDDIVPEPAVVIEIASLETECEDRGRKKFDYFATPSIRQYAIVEQDERRVDLYTRAEAGWTNEVVTGDAAVNLSSIGVVLNLDTIYEDTELDATRRQAGGEPAPAA
jgi:Uma2 family endonuclease